MRSLIQRIVTLAGWVFASTLVGGVVGWVLSRVQVGFIAQ